jgi:hypothetical protein
MDVVVTTNDGPAYLLHNETASPNHWLTFKLVGHKSNRDGIGAVVKVVTQASTQYTIVSTSGSYLSSSDKRAHFGLGAEISADRVEIHWPSGIIQTLNQVRADQTIEVEESDSVK